MTGRRVLLTGGAGFVGHHLGLALRARGAEVHVADSLAVNNLHAFMATPPETPHRERTLGILRERLALLAAAGVSLHLADTRDAGGMARLLETLRPHAVVHLAAVSHADRCTRDPLGALDHNLAGLTAVLEAARGVVEHFVFFSSSLVYGDVPEGGVTEDSPCRPAEIYGALKYAGEQLVTAYGRVHGLAYTIVRPAALYGERCVSRRVGQVFIENAMDGHELVVTGDGSARLDFTCVHDLVEGVAQVLDVPAARNQVLNLAFGGARTMDELVGILSAHLPGVRVRYAPRDAGAPRRGTLRIDRAARLIGYAPRTRLEDGYARYIRWYREVLSAAPSATEPAPV